MAQVNLAPPIKPLILSQSKDGPSRPARRSWFDGFTMTGSMFLAAMSAFCVPGPVAAQAPIEIRAEPDLTGIHLARSGWMTGAVRLINRADREITGALIARGVDQNYPPSLLGEREYPAVTVPARASIVVPVIFSRSWRQTSFVLRDATGRRLSDLDGDTVIVTGGDPREAHERISIISTDQTWAARMNEVIGYQASMIADFEHGFPNPSVNLIVDVLSPPSAPANRLNWMKEAVSPGRAVLFVLRGPLESLPRDLASKLFNSGAPPDTLVAQNPSREISLYRGAHSSWLLTMPPANMGEHLETEELVPLLIRTPFQSSIDRASDGGGYSIVDRGLFHRIRSQPPLGFFVILLGLYALVIVPGTYIILGRRRRRELAWLLLPGAGLAVSFGILAVGGYQHGWRDRVAVYEVIRDFGSEEPGEPELPRVRREIVIGCFSGSFGEKRFAIHNANAASPIPSNNMHNGAFMEKGLEAGPIAIRPNGPDGLEVEVPILFWAGRSFRFALIETGVAAPAAGDAFAQAPRHTVRDGSWGDPTGSPGGSSISDASDVETMKSEEALIRSLTQTSAGSWNVAIRDGLPPDLILPPGADVVAAKRIHVRRTR
jgi:hypothetical protein